MNRVVPFAFRYAAALRLEMPGRITETQRKRGNRRLGREFQPDTLDAAESLFGELYGPLCQFRFRSRAHHVTALLLAAAVAEQSSQDTAPEVYQERIPLADGCLLVTHDNRVWHYVNGEKVAEVTAISLTKPHMEGNGK